MLGLLTQVDKELTDKVAKGLGMSPPKEPQKPMNHGVGADDNGEQEPISKESKTKKSDALSMLKNDTLSETIETRQIAFLCADDVDAKSVSNMKKALEEKGAEVKILAPHQGMIKCTNGDELAVDQSYLIAASVLFDGVFVPAGKGILQLKQKDEVIEFINDSFKHCKIIGAEGEGNKVLLETNAKNKTMNADDGVITSDLVGENSLKNAFIKRLSQHRFWQREELL